MRLFDLTQEERGTINITINHTTREYEANFDRCKLEDIRGILVNLIQRIDSGEFLAEEGITVSHE